MDVPTDNIHLQLRQVVIRIKCMPVLIDLAALIAKQIAGGKSLLDKCFPGIADLHHGFFEIDVQTIKGRGFQKTEIISVSNRSYQVRNAVR